MWWGRATLPRAASHCSDTAWRGAANLLALNGGLRGLDVWRPG
jgi:hypothetical protein